MPTERNLNSPKSLLKSAIKLLQGFVVHSLARMAGCRAALTPVVSTQEFALELTQIDHCRASKTILQAPGSARQGVLSHCSRVTACIVRANSACGRLAGPEQRYMRPYVPLRQLHQLINLTNRRLDALLDAKRSSALC
jgi:hypothetical protein